MNLEAHRGLLRTFSDRDRICPAWREAREHNEKAIVNTACAAVDFEDHPELAWLAVRWSNATHDLWSQQ
ncbi:hypothetical protein [Nocardia terpenica]|uniref:hypothetical protein n=1 Tax=Nocardia terpenica TaxID=455432 RepID=UPI0012FE6429|nr:hypothetical protein [Nocardia terpenica]